MEDYRPRIMCFSCKFGWGFLNPEPSKAMVAMPCSGKIDTSHILTAFARGADGVLILACAEGDCHFQDGNFKTEAKVHLIRRVLPAFGVEPERLKVVTAIDPEGEKMAGLISDMARTLAPLGPIHLGRKNAVNPMA